MQDNSIALNDLQYNRWPQIDKPQLQHLQQVQKGRIFSLLSGAGGVGKSTLSLLIAAQAKQQRVRVALLDFDLQFSDLPYLAGLDKVGECSYLFEYVDLASFNVPRFTNADLVPILARSELSLQNASDYTEALGELLCYCRTNFQLTIVNTGSFWSDLQAELLQNSDRLCFVADGRPSAVRAVRIALDYCDMLNIPRAICLGVMNRVTHKQLITATDAGMLWEMNQTAMYEVSDAGVKMEELMALGRVSEALAVSKLLRKQLSALIDQQSLGQSHIEPAVVRKKRDSAILRFSEPVTDEVRDVA